LSFSKAAFAGLLAALVLFLGINLFPLMVDDAYITYSYARNFARSGDLVYHATNPRLSTSAPFYAILLGIAGKAGLAIPATSNVLGAAGIFGAALCLFLLGYRNERPWMGATAALLVAVSPLLWLSLGLETAFHLFLVCATFYGYDRGHYTLAGLLVGLATVTRPDGILLAGILAGYHLYRKRERVPARAVAGFLLIFLPLALYLILEFGSPVPVTLQAKQAQAEFRVTGFYEGTSLPAGLGILLRGWLDQSWLYLLWLPLLLLGVRALPVYPWSWGVIAYGLLHFAGYWVLGVSPYYWYYAPLYLAAAMVAGAGVQYLAERVPVARARPFVAALPLLLVLVAHAFSLEAMITGLTGPLPDTTGIQAKVLPEAKGDIYREIGRWLNAHTAEDATVAVIEVGIMGYYADRPMVDFLGLLQSDVAQALARDDLFYAIPAYLPDYIVLGQSLAVYNLWLGNDEWFREAYVPVEQFDDPRFWGSPLLVFRRSMAARPLSPRPAGNELLEGLVLAEFALDREQVRAGEALQVEMEWMRGETMTAPLHTIAYLVNDAEEVVHVRDVAIQPGRWPVGQAVGVYYPLLIPGDLPPGEYRLRVRALMEDQTDAIRELASITITP